MSAERRPAAIIITAAKGFKNDARSLIGRAIRNALGIRQWLVMPHMVSYISESEARSYGAGDARYTLDVTDAEMADIEDELFRLAALEG
jgi:hypothetical protein